MVSTAEKHNDFPIIIGNKTSLLNFWAIHGQYSRKAQCTMKTVLA